MPTATRAIVLLLLSVCVRAQEFDAISIKANNSGVRERSLRAMPGQVAAPVWVQLQR